MSLSSELLREYIIKMAQEVELSLVRSTEPSFTLDDIFQIEHSVNHYHKLIDDTGFKLLALKAPTATELRLTLSIFKMNAELERIGDQAVSIKRYYDKIENLHPKLLSLKGLVEKMLHQVLDAFVHANTKKAAKTIDGDKEINELYRDLMKEFLQSMKDGQMNFEEGFSSIWIAKNLERIGDQCTNIAEGIIFLVSANDVRHDPAVKSRRDGDPSQFDQFLKQLDENNPQGNLT